MLVKIATSNHTLCLPHINLVGSFYPLPVGAVSASAFLRRWSGQTTPGYVHPAGLRALNPTPAPCAVPLFGCQRAFLFTSVNLYFGNIHDCERMSSGYVQFCGQLTTPKRPNEKLKLEIERKVGLDKIKDEEVEGE